jgi:hypothetical protein
MEVQEQVLEHQEVPDGGSSGHQDQVDVVQDQVDHGTNTGANGSSGSSGSAGTSGSAGSSGASRSSGSKWIIRIKLVEVVCQAHQAQVEHQGVQDQVDHLGLTGANWIIWVRVLAVIRFWIKVENHGSSGTSGKCRIISYWIKWKSGFKTGDGSGGLTGANGSSGSNGSTGSVQD